MTSISPPVHLPQASNNTSQAVASHSPSASVSGKPASQAAGSASAKSSYANATKSTFSSPSGPSEFTPSAAAGQHGKQDSNPQVYGRIPIPPAVPAVASPTVVNGNPPTNSSSSTGDHGRKPSVTISAASAPGYAANGPPGIGKPTGSKDIQFGAMGSNASPDLRKSSPQPPQSSATLSVNNPSNPRIHSPQTSPSPIPQPPASGGKPPSAAALHSHNNSVYFGSFGGGGDGNIRSSSFSQAPLMPGPQTSHLRRESSHSQHSDMSNHGMIPPVGRGYPQQGGRGRGGYGPSYGQHIPFSPGPQNFRPPPHRNSSVGSFQQQQGRQYSPYPGSPHQAPRQPQSPMPPNAQPLPNQPVQMSMQNPYMGQVPYGYAPQAYGYNPNMVPQQGYPMPQDPNYNMQWHGMYSQQSNMQTPQSPRPPHQYPPGPQTPFQGQYAPHPPPMSRTSSAVSGTDRPASSMGKAQTSSTPAPSHVSASQPSNSPAPKTNHFQKPKKSSGIVIKDPNSGEVVNLKHSASPAPSNKSSTSISAAPTPPPSVPAPNDQSHSRSESKSITKTDGKDLREQLARQHREKEETEAKAAQAKQDEEEKLQKQKEEADAKQLEAAKAQMDAEDALKKNKAEAAAAEEAVKKAEAEAAQKAEAARAEANEKSNDDPAITDADIARWEAEAEEEAKREAEREAAYAKKKQAEKDEAARKEAEAFKMAQEDMQRAEREAEEAEEARMREKEKEETESEVPTASADTPMRVLGTPGVETPAEDTPEDSGVATPASDAQAMPPPDRKASAIAAAKPKPSALKLETSKSVDPPQPSAALMSLRSARKLTSLDIHYPAGKASPNPAINVAAKIGKFRYDRDFLLQFKEAFKEKPSENWSEKIRETVGDTSDAQSARNTPRSSAGGSLLASRQTSRQGPAAMQGPMGSFNGAGPGARSLPAGTTSEQRFQASNPSRGMSSGRQPMQNPLSGYVSRPGAFPQPSGSIKMDRTPSSTSLVHPNSPRTGSQRGGSQRGSRARREDPKDNKTMPLTAGANLKPIEITATGWKPRSVGAAAMSGPALGGDGPMAPDVVQRKVKSNLNKMTPNNFDKISGQILEIAHQSKHESDGRSLRQVIQLTFEKATDEAHWAEMYAQFCKRMLESMSSEIKDENILDKKGEVVVGGALFRKYLLTRCQTEFERGWKVNLPDQPEGDTEEIKMLSEEYYLAAAAKRRGLGLVRFIGELYKLQMLTERIMHECVKKLVDYEGIPDEAEVESLTSLLKTIGQQLDSSEKGHSMMDAYFARINNMVAIKDLPSRMKFMLMDVVDLRVKHRWQSKGGAALKGPTTIDGVRAQVVEQERQKEVQRAQDNSRRGGPSGRPPQGRGDARQFSGGGPQFGAPPPDYHKNTVGMDDLRRLGRGGISRQTSTAAPTFGPTSMFASARGSNPRKPLNLASTNDSGASSRVSTPPAQKEKKEENVKSSSNAFSLLASAEGSGDATSPGPSPAPAKATPAISEVAKGDAEPPNQS